MLHFGCSANIYTEKVPFRCCLLVGWLVWFFVLLLVWFFVVVVSFCLLVFMLRFLFFVLTLRGAAMSLRHEKQQKDVTWFIFLPHMPALPMTAQTQTAGH